MDAIELLKAAALGVIEGITEWLPVSSTGHMILADEFLRLSASDAFKEMFLVVVQLAAILAVVIVYWKRLLPYKAVGESGPAGAKAAWDRTLGLWLRIVIASVPAALIGIPFNDSIDALFYNYQTVAVTLVVYGVLFIVVESTKRKGDGRIGDAATMPLSTAALIGVFQLLALIPGTSRSGATILGAVLLGATRGAAAEFSFFLAIPAMAGASLIKLLKFGLGFSGQELAVLGVASVAAFAVSILSIRFLTAWVRSRSFKGFGWYRIALGIAVAAFFVLSGRA